MASCSSVEPCGRAVIIPAFVSEACSLMSSLAIVSKVVAQPLLQRLCCSSLAIVSKVVAQPLLQRLCCSSLAIVSKVVAQPHQRLCCTSLHDLIAYCPSLQNRHCTITVAQARSVVAVQPKPCRLLFASGRTPTSLRQNFALRSAAAPHLKNGKHA